MGDVKKLQGFAEQVSRAIETPVRVERLSGHGRYSVKGDNWGVSVLTFAQAWWLLEGLSLRAEVHAQTGRGYRR